MSKVAGSKRASEYWRRPQLMSYRMARHLSAGAVVRVVVAQVGWPPKTLEGSCPALEARGAFDAADVRSLEKSCAGLGPVLRAMQVRLEQGFAPGVMSKVKEVLESRRSSVSACD
jgi:hypothetical protein